MIFVTFILSFYSVPVRVILIDNFCVEYEEEARIPEAKPCRNPTIERKSMHSFFIKNLGFDTF